MDVMIRDVFVNVLVTLGGLSILISALPYFRETRHGMRQIALGLLFGVTVAGSIAAAFPIGPGIYGDLRNAIVAVAALSVGPVAAIIAVVTATLFRLTWGGQVAGALAGLFGCAALSIAFAALPVRKTTSRLVLFGSALAMANALVPFLGLITGSTSLPDALGVSGAILLAGMSLYPIGVAAMVNLLKDAIARLDHERSLVASNHQMSATMQRFRDVFDLSCVPMAWVDLQSHRFLRANKEYELFCGYSESELQDMTVDQLSVPEHREDDISTIESLASGDTASINGERCYRRKDGSVRWGSRTITATPDGRHGKRALAIVQDITEKRHASQQVAFLAEHDPLTALANRLYFSRELEDATSSAEGEQFALLLIDLDEFKMVNDTRGHATGDQLLLHVADTLRSSLGVRDVVARIGGDEFAVVRRHCTPEEAVQLSADIIARMRSPAAVGSQIMSVGATIGVATYPTDGKSPTELMKKADIALYAAKAKRKGAAVLFAPDMERQIAQRERTTSELALALTKSEFELDFQPLVDFHSGEVCAFEALLRWNHPVRGRVPPAEFIPLLEESGAIVIVGEWVLREACLQAATWPAHVGIAINLSVRQFEQTLPLIIASALAKSGLSPARLQLELTESVLVSESAAEVLHQIHELGASIALDDFGTGFSSLSYLQRLPFDKLKIDRSFVSGIAKNDQSRTIARTIIQLAHSLGMRVTAEGIETIEQMDHLRKEGCDEGQGYLFSRPVSASQVASLIGASRDEAQAS